MTTFMQCEAIDLVKTKDDAVAVRCPRAGIKITETDTILGRKRQRVVCEVHRSGWTPS